MRGRARHPAASAWSPPRHARTHRTWQQRRRRSRFPAELAEPIRALLQPEATVVMRGANRLEFWWVKALPLDSAPEGRPSWSNVADGALVGAVTFAKAMTDTRGLPMKPGVYTLRFALQPQDGDHMGVSPHREFLLVCARRRRSDARARRLQRRGRTRQEDARQVAPGRPQPEPDHRRSPQAPSSPPTRVTRGWRSPFRSRRRARPPVRCRSP